MKYYFIFFCVSAVSFLFSCTNNSEVENSTSDLKDSILINNSDSIKVVTKKYLLKSNEEEAVLEWPQINGEVPKEALDRMNNAISIDSICGESIEQIELNYKDCSCGTIGASYTVNYNTHNMLSLSISVETMGAYPDGFVKNYNFIVQTGSTISLDSLIKKDSLPSLTRRLNMELVKRIEEAKAIVHEDEEKTEDGEFINDLFDRTEFSKEDLNNFIITDKGITFFFEFGFPHVAQALEPAGDFFIPKEELKRYLTDGTKL